MELKWGTVEGQCINIIKFQSYLYGIEILEAFPKFFMRRSFNRTFMELKYCTRAHPLAEAGVSIVPLWN